MRDSWSYLELYSQGGLVPFDIEICRRDLDYLTKLYSPVIKDNNKKVYMINKENLLKNNGISTYLVKSLNECRGNTLVVEIWDGKYER